MSLLLASVPVLVESSLALITDMLGEDGLEGSESTGGLDISNNSDSDHWGSLNDGDGFNNFLLVRPGSDPVYFTEDVRHASFVSHEGGKMTRLGLVVLGEGLHFTPVTGASLTREESKGSVPGGSKLTMTHDVNKLKLKLK